MNRAVAFGLLAAAAGVAATVVGIVAWCEDPIVRARDPWTTGAVMHTDGNCHSIVSFVYEDAVLVSVPFVYAGRCTTPAIDPGMFPSTVSGSPLLAFPLCYPRTRPWDAGTTCGFAYRTTLALMCMGLATAAFGVLITVAASFTGARA